MKKLSALAAIILFATSMILSSCNSGRSLCPAYPQKNRNRASIQQEYNNLQNIETVKFEEQL